MINILVSRSGIGTMHAREHMTFAFPRLPVRIGRNPDSDCYLHFPFISRRHAVIELVSARVILKDEGSRNGTWVFGHHVKLEPGEAADLASVGWEFFLGPDVRVRVDAASLTDGAAGVRIAHPHPDETANEPTKKTANPDS